MVVKFFGNTKGGSTASIDYLLNKRQEAKTARTLQGDPKLTKELIRSIERKQKVCVGCLSFEEANIPEADKYKLMDEFEKTLLPDMQGRYNILWVEHTDKGRLELNFVIPRVDLETGKGLSPYYHASDAKGMRLFQQVHNLENGWSDPKDPSKERTLQGASKMLNLQRDYEQLDTLLHNLVKEGAIQNRTQLIETLEASKINVTRKGQDSISVKLPESLKARKLKGGIYAEQFRSLGDIETISERAKERVREYNQRDTQRELAGAKQDLEKYVQYKHGELRERYSKPIREVGAEISQNKELDHHNLDRNREHERSNVSDMDLHERENAISTIQSTRAVAVQGNENGQKDDPNTRARSQSDRWQEISLHGRIGEEYEQEINSIGATALERIRAEREASKRALRRAERERRSVHNGAETSNKELRGNGDTHQKELRGYFNRIGEYVKVIGEKINVMLERTKERLFRKQEAEKPKSWQQQLKEDTAEAKKELTALQKAQAMQAKALTREEIAKIHAEAKREGALKEDTHTHRRSHGHSLSR